MKRFNTTAVCIPSKHYMVDLTERVKEIKKMVDDGEYFTINRARQYGKTTTLNALKNYLTSAYDVISLDFQGMGYASFEDEQSFCKDFVQMILEKQQYGLFQIPTGITEQLKLFVSSAPEDRKMGDMMRLIRRWCRIAKKPVVLLIDEVDSATNNQVFLDFLAQLRDGYISRDTDEIPTFQSVILAGVTDIKHLRSKIRDADQHKVNSPWNIAADFDIDMSLSESGIKGMLDEYEADHHTGMNSTQIAKQIRDYTRGYPYLVSRICQLLDEKMVPARFSTLADAWTEYGVDETVKVILSENNSLFQSLTGKLVNYPELRKQLRDILLKGETYAWLPYDEEQQQLHMYGFIRNNHNTIAVANRIFEMLLYVHFIGENQKNNDIKQLASDTKPMFVEEDGWLNIPKIMEHFIKEHNRIHEGRTEKFLEEEGRERFITYVSGIINGTGTYSVEEQTRSQRRMDLVIHYLGQRYIVELKIWRGERYNADGEKQISDYLDYWGLATGYLLSFSFIRDKKPGVERVQFGDKILFEGIV
ncbi:MAG: AAA family ATPase [Clostridia bacterium]|nr:AAA family ATPase [Clostridia bacterium]